MLPIKHACLILGFVAGIVLSSRPSGAQYTADYQTNIISGVTSNWSGDYVVGSNTFADVLLIQNSGVLSNGNGYIGYTAAASNNSVLVTDSGSVWSNFVEVRVGYQGSGNSLVISNGGKVISGFGFIGHGSGGSNSVLVTDSGSVWSNSSYFRVGYFGSGNSLVINNGGKVVNFYGYIGDFSSSNNSVLVSGSGSVWSNDYELDAGYYSGGNSLVISNGGKVFSRDGWIGYNASSNSVLVSGSGSVWSSLSQFSSYFYIGSGFGNGNSLVISNGGKVVSGDSHIDGGPGGGNSVLVTDSGSVWTNLGFIHVGSPFSGSSLAINNGGTVVSSNLFLGSDPGSTNNFITLNGGNLTVANALGNGVLVVGRGTFTMNSSDTSVGVDRFVATNGVSSIVTFNGGTLNSGGTSVTNAQTFTVGNGSSTATFHLNGGVHSFNDGLRIRANAVLSGCGTINGSVLVDLGGIVLADCGGTLTFTGAVTNNGTLRAVNGTTLEFYGPVVNNGLIDVINGSTNFHSTFINHGILLDAAGDWDGDGMSNLEEFQAGTDPTNSASVFRIIEIRPDDDDMFLTWTAVGGKRYALQTTTGYGGSFSNNFIDLNPAIVVRGTGETEVSVLHLGAATNGPVRYYRVRLVP